jgi:hypothetical protein
MANGAALALGIAGMLIGARVHPDVPGHGCRHDHRHVGRMVVRRVVPEWLAACAIGSIRSHRSVRLSTRRGLDTTGNVTALKSRSSA